jgi:hypothetical protein
LALGTETFVTWQYDRELPREFAAKLHECRRIVKPRIVPMVLDNAASDGGSGRVVMLDEECRGLGADFHLAVDDVEPIGNGRAGENIGLVSEAPAVGEVVHGETASGGVSSSRFLAALRPSINFCPSWRRWNSTSSVV